jgi:O-antigen ligase
MELLTIVIALRHHLLKALLRWNWPLPVIAAALVLALTAWSTAAEAPTRWLSLTLTSYWCLHALFAISVAHLCGRLFEPRDLIFAYIAGFWAFAAQFIVYVSLIPDWATFNWKTGFMAFSHIRHVGYYLAPITAMGLALFSTGNSRDDRALGLATAITALSIVLWTGSRGAAVAVAGSVAAAALFVPSYRKLRSFVAAATTYVVATIVVWLTPPVPSALMGLAHTVQATEASDISTGRMTIWRNVIAAIRRHGYLGYGEGQMHTVAPFSIMVHPHDIILQVILAWGVLGLACVAVLGAYFTSKAVVTVRAHPLPVLAPFMAMASIAILSLYDGALYYALPISIFMACGAVIASQWTSKASSEGGIVVS